MTSEKIKELLALEAKATAGPWFEQREYDGSRTVCQMRHQTETWCVNRATHVNANPWEAVKENGLLIAMARNNIREMAEEILAWREGRYWLSFERHDVYKKILDKIASAVTGKTGDGWTYVPDTLADEIRAMRVKLEAAEARIAELEGTWMCFHCGFVTKDEAQAAAHFGDRDDPAFCRHWQSMSPYERGDALQDLIQQLNSEREENAKLRTANEGLEYRLMDFENLLGSRFKGCRTINEAFNQFDSMEGRALAAEARVRELEAAGKVLVQFVFHLSGYSHSSECYHDGMCKCARQFQDPQLNAACRVVEGEL